MSTISSWQRIGQGPCTPKAPPKLSCNAERHQSGVRARTSLLSLGLPHVVWQRDRLLWLLLDLQPCLGLFGSMAGMGSCCSKHSQRGRWLGLVEESPCAVEACWVMLLCHWLSLWDGNLGSGSDGKVTAGRRKVLQGFADPMEERQRGCFCRMLNCPTCVTGFDMDRERSSRSCSA